MKKLILIIGLLPLMVFGQKITLDSCVNAAKQNWPAFKKQLAIAGQRQLIDETLNKNRLPKLNLSGQATYQSEAVTFPEVPTIPGFFPEFPQDNYNVELGVNQVIWDGGAVKFNKAMQYAANEVEVEKLNVETFGLIGKINQLYTQYLFLDKSGSILKVSAGELDKNMATLQSAYQNGAILKSDLNNIKAERLKLKKEMVRVELSKLNVLTTLNLITGLQLDTTRQFIVPQIKQDVQAVRPELALMDAQLNFSGSAIAKYKTVRMPKFFAFGKAGYGRPGYDFMNTDLHGYYMVGAKFTWQVFDWNLFKKKKEQVVLQQQIISDNKAIMAKQISIEEQRYLNEIDQYQQQTEIDAQIEQLKKSVYLAAESQMKNGTITSTEYLKLFNEWKRAKLTSELDKLKLITARLNYNHAKGADIVN